MCCYGHCCCFLFPFFPQIYDFSDFEFLASISRSMPNQSPNPKSQLSTRKAHQRSERTPNPRLTRVCLIFIVCYLLIFFSFDLVSIWLIDCCLPQLPQVYLLFAGPQPTLFIISSRYRQLPATTIANWQTN